MRCRADAGRRHCDLAWIGLRAGDQLSDRRGRDRWVRLQYQRIPGKSGNWRDIAAEIETKLFIQRSIDRVCRSDEEERVAVRGSPHDRLRGDISTGARLVFDDDRLTEPV